MDAFIMAQLTIIAIVVFGFIFALVVKRIEKKKKSTHHTPEEHRGG